MTLSLLSCSEDKLKTRIVDSGPDQEPESSGTRGGGDPLVSEFLLYASNISNWMMDKSYDSAMISEKVAKDFDRKVKELIQQMDDPLNPSIRFTDQVLKDDSVTVKVAIFQTQPQLIFVNRKPWSHLDLEDRMLTVALEIYGLLGIEKRYSDVYDMIISHFSEILGWSHRIPFC